MNAFEIELGGQGEALAQPDASLAVDGSVGTAGSQGEEGARTGGAAGRRTRTPKGEQTRALILETALDLFRERGYEETTMRAIAERADVALGNTYYYFRSKEHLIQAFYARSHREHLAAALPILERERDLKARLRGVLRAKIDTSEPYHRFSGILFKTAADPQSPLSPFSPESNAVRREATALMAEVVRGSNVRVPKDLDAELPNLLWLYMMGIVLFWIHDFSPVRARTYTLVDHTSDLVARTIGLATVPLLRPLRRRVLQLLADLRQETAGDPTELTAQPASAESPGNREEKRS